MSIHTTNCSYTWGDGSDPANNERQVYHWHLTEGDKKLAEEWCERNGWTDLFIQPDAPDKFWAFPPNCDMPEPIKMETVQRWKR